MSRIEFFLQNIAEILTGTRKGSGQLRAFIGNSKGEWVVPAFNGECRASIGELPNGVGSAGPRPRYFRMGWAMLDLSSQTKNARNKY